MKKKKKILWNVKRNTHYTKGEKHIRPDNAYLNKFATQVICHFKVCI